MRRQGSGFTAEISVNWRVVRFDGDDEAERGVIKIMKLVAAHFPALLHGVDPNRSARIRSRLDFSIDRIIQ